MSTIDIIVVDDHQIVRDGIKALFLTSKNINVVGEAASYYELMVLLSQITPHILILDITLPGKSGVEITRDLKQSNPCIKILILSANTDEENITGAIKAGADGFLPKDTSKEEFIEAIETIMGGEEFFGAKLSKVIFKSYSQQVRAIPTDEASPSLSERELAIIKFLADGLSSKEIGEKLCISSRTVETHKANILVKLNLKNNADIIKYAIREGIVGLG